MAENDAFPPGHDEKIPLEEPQLWKVGEFKSYERMAVSRGNTALHNVFENTRTKLPRLIATVRWSKLRMPLVGFAHAAGMSSNGYHPMEQDRKPTGRAHLSKYTRLLDFWEQNGISFGIREQLLDLLINPDFLELDESCVDLLTAIQHIRTQTQHLLTSNDMAAFYHRVGYDKGHAVIEQDFPGLYSATWQWEKIGTVPEFLKLINFVETMYSGESEAVKQKRKLRMAQAEALFDVVKRNQYLGRTLEKPLADFLVAIEKDLAFDQATTLTAKSLGDKYHLSSSQSEKLIQMQLLPVGTIEPIARCVMDPATVEGFLKEWDKAYGTEMQRSKFGAECAGAMQEQGLNSADLGRLLEVKAPEFRGKQAKRSKQRYRPDSEVRGVLSSNRVSSQIPVEALIQLIASGEYQANQLRNSYVSERKRFFVRNGYRKSGEGLRMCISRELAGASMSELARLFLPAEQRGDKQAVRQKDLELQRLERQEGTQHDITFAAVFVFLKQISDEKVAAALQRLSTIDEMDEKLKEFSTVPEMAHNLIVGMRGAKAISETMQSQARCKTQRVRPDLITKMSQGTYVPALPALRLMANCTVHRTLPLPVVLDWYQRMPEQLRQGLEHFGQFKQPLARVLCTLIATIEASPLRFFSTRVPSRGLVPELGTKHLRQINAGETVEWSYINQYLLALTEPGKIPYRLAQELYKNGGNVKQAAATLLPEIQAGQADVNAMTLPGLLPAELALFIANDK